jgi:GWxTD domain-containing protein
MYFRTTQVCHAILVLFLLLFAQCGTAPQLGSSGAGKTIGYQPGVPNFDTEVIATWREGEPGIDIYSGITYRSLTFVRSSTQFVAVFQTTVIVSDWESQDHVLEREWVDSVVVTQYGETQSFNPFVQSRRIALKPGSYRVDMTVRDATSNKSAVRTQGVEVFALAPGRPAMSAMWLQSRGQTGSFGPVVALHVPSTIGRLKASAMVYDLESIEAPVVDWLLLKIASDTSVAGPPYGYQQASDGLLMKGVDFERRDTLAMKQELVAPTRTDTMVEFDLPMLDKGMYIVLARLVDRLGGNTRDTLLLQQRYDLSVKGPNFPHPSTLEALIPPLAYIAKEDELSAIRTAKTPQEQRREFELFWLKLTGSEQVASNVIKQYYTRVEEANLFFTTYKEGWKTDRGMVYIILGPPLSVTTRASDEIWLYSYDETDPLSIFLFELVRETNTGPAFPNYTLVRRSYYADRWERTVQRWRRGTIQ